MITNSSTYNSINTVHYGSVLDSLIVCLLVNDSWQRNDVLLTEITAQVSQQINLMYNAI